MNTSTTPAVETTQGDVTVILMLARLLDRLDTNPEAADPGQYQSVVRHLSHHLRLAAANPVMGALLDAYPAASMVYENLNYQHAGLCRSPLESSLAAELSAREAIDRARGAIRLSR